MATGRTRLGGGKAFHSILEPHRELIQSLRRSRKTWKEIAQTLAREKGVSVTLQGVYQFYRRWTRRSRTGHWEQESPAPQPTTEPSSHKKPRPAPVLPGSGFRKPNRSSFQQEDYL